MSGSFRQRPAFPEPRTSWLSHGSLRLAESGRRQRAIRRSAAIVGGLLLLALAGAMIPRAGKAPSMAEANATVSSRALPLPAGPAGVASVVPPSARLGTSPEDSLLAAYQAWADGDVARARQISQDLARDHPTFPLGQLLLADLLATRSGRPSALGGSLQAQGATAELEPLQLEARRRLAALRDPPPVGQVPREFVALPPSIRNAVAVDASRSRLYLFNNGPEGLTLAGDYYVSLGKLGVAKRDSGDLRTPLGVYWITSSMAAHQIAPQFGAAALGINYPNAWDRHEGRSGSGLFVHGVPQDILARLPWATDGCVAMANEDLMQFAARLTPVDTPVLIARQLDWVPPQTAMQTAPDFRKAYDAWDRARRAGDASQVSIWYEAAALADGPIEQTPEARADLSLIAWNGDSAPMMIATARDAPDADGKPALAVRQYWIQRDGQWRIFFEGQVPGPIVVGAQRRTVTPAAPALAKNIAAGGQRRTVTPAAPVLAKKKVSPTRRRLAAGPAGAKSRRS